MKNLKNTIISILIALVGAVLMGCLAVFALMLIIPSRDEEGHAAMPIFQFAMGWLVGIISFFAISILTFRKIRHRDFPIKMGNRPIVLLYLLISVLFAFDVIISFYGYSFSGYYADKIINWIWLGFTIFIIVYFWKKKSVRIYFYSLLILIGLSILPMAIPFFGIVYYFSTIGDFQQITINETYRLERTRPNVMAKGNIIVIYENQGLLEKTIATSQCLTCMAMYVSDSPEEIKDNIDDAQLVKITKDSITIEATVENKETRFTYPVIK